MRIVRWLCAWLLLAAGCRWVVSLDRLTDGEPATGAGGAGGVGGAGGNGGAAGAGMLDATGGSSVVDSDASGDGNPADGPLEVLPGGPLWVRSTTAPIGGIAVFGDDIYWVEQGLSGGIYHAPKTSSDPPETIENSTMAFDVAVDNDFVYWSNTNNTVTRKGRADASPSSFFPGSGMAVRYLSADGQGGVFYTSRSFIGYGPPLQSTSFQRYSGADVPVEVFGLATTGTRLFWGHANGVSEGSTDGAKVVTPVYMAGSARGVATDGQAIYWMTAMGEIQAAPVGGAARTPRRVCARVPRPDATTLVDGDTDIAVDDLWVYFTEPGLNQIYKCLK